MMIVSLPDHYPAPPGWDISNFRDQQKQEQGWIDEISALIKTDFPDETEYTGRVVKTPIGDGYAMYMVVNQSYLVHLPLGDAWHSEIVEHWTFDDVIGRLDAEARLRELFS